MRKLTILWAGIGAIYWVIYITAMQGSKLPMGSGLIAVLCFMTASIIECMPKRIKHP